jgi:hypothetical protein
LTRIPIEITSTKTFFVTYTVFTGTVDPAYSIWHCRGGDLAALDSLRLARSLYPMPQLRCSELQVKRIFVETLPKLEFLFVFREFLFYFAKCWQNFAIVFRKMLAKFAIVFRKILCNKIKSIRFESRYKKFTYLALFE